MLLNTKLSLPVHSAGCPVQRRLGAPSTAVCHVVEGEGQVFLCAGVGGCSRAGRDTGAVSSPGVRTAFPFSRGSDSQTFAATRGSAGSSGSLWRRPVAAVGEKEEVLRGHHSRQALVPLNSTSLWQPWALCWQGRHPPLPVGSHHRGFCSAPDRRLNHTTQPARSPRSPVTGSQWHKCSD